MSQYLWMQMEKLNSHYRQKAGPFNMPAWMKEASLRSLWLWLVVEWGVVFFTSVANGGWVVKKGFQDERGWGTSTKLSKNRGEKERIGVMKERAHRRQCQRRLCMKELEQDWRESGRHRGRAWGMRKKGWGGGAGVQINSSESWQERAGWEGWENRNWNGGGASLGYAREMG